MTLQHLHLMQQAQTKIYHSKHLIKQIDNEDPSKYYIAIWEDLFI